LDCKTSPFRTSCGTASDHESTFYGVCVVKLRRNVFPNLGPRAQLLLSKEVYRHQATISFLCANL
jgi:hypothetical protein